MTAEEAAGTLALKGSVIGAEHRLVDPADTRLSDNARTMQQEALSPETYARQVSRAVSGEGSHDRGAFALRVRRDF
jgi:hypothetical protein